MQIHLNKGYIASFFLLCVSIGLLFAGIKNLYGANHAIPVDQLSIDACKKGQYVEGTIDQYQGLVVQNLGSGKFLGSSQVYTNEIFHTSEFYTIPVANGQYITAMVDDRETLRQLEGFDHGTARSVEDQVYFTGKVVKLPVEINEKWHEEFFHVENADQLRAFISTEYAIRQTDFKNIKNDIFNGIAVFAISAILFTKSGGRKELLGIHIM